MRSKAAIQADSCNNALLSLVERVKCLLPPRGTSWYYMEGAQLAGGLEKQDHILVDFFFFSRAFELVLIFGGRFNFCLGRARRF